MELVTGKVGHDHVLSEQAGSMHAGIFGTGTYVLGTGSKLAATMVNANTVRIADGDLMMQGRHCTIAEGQYDDLVVQNGTQNQRRSDLVVARYERLAEEPRTESVSLKVVKGQPSDGEPEDPKIEEGDILGGDLVSEVALYRIPLDGISVGDPEPLFDLLAPMSQIKNELDGLRDSVSRHIVGQKRITFGSRSTWEVIWTKDEFESLTGRTFDPAKVGIALRNDSAGIGGGTVSASLLGTSILAQYAVEPPQGATMTVGYTIVFSD